MKPAAPAPRRSTARSLFDRVGVEVADPEPTRQYLLFAAAGPPSGGVDDLLEVFSSEGEARRAFLLLRQDEGLRRGWAELAAVDWRGRVSVLCSFGRGRPVPWRPRPLVHLPQTKRGTAMSTTSPTKPATPSRPPHPRPSRIRYLVASVILGVASMGAGILATLGGESTSPVPNRAPAASQPVPPIPLPQGNETFPGCLNDIECSGEPSNLPPGYWDLPTTASSVD